MFPLGERSFRLPGLGSYLQTAASANPVNTHALLWGLAVLILIIVATDQLVWRPLVAWSDKFKFEGVESATRVTSPILTLLQRPSAFTRVPARAWSALGESVCQHLSRSRECRVVQPIDDSASKGGRLLPILLGVFVGMAGIWGLFRAFQMLHGVTWADVRLLLHGRGSNLSPGQHHLAHRRALDRPCWCCNWSQSEAGKISSTDYPSGGLDSCNSLVSSPSAGPHPAGRRTWHRLGRSHVAGSAVVRSL